MAKRRQKTQKSQTTLHELVIVTFAENLAQAKDYETLLKINDIPAIIKEQPKQSMNTKAIAIMVPEDFVDEAHVVIESQDAYDDFYDSASEEDLDNDDLNTDLFDDDFQPLTDT